MPVPRVVINDIACRQPLIVVVTPIAPFGSTGYQEVHLLTRVIVFRESLPGIDIHQSQYDIAHIKNRVEIHDRHLMSLIDGTGRDTPRQIRCKRRKSFASFISLTHCKLRRTGRGFAENDLDCFLPICPDSLASISCCTRVSAQSIMALAQDTTKEYTCSVTLDWLKVIGESINRQIPHVEIALRYWFTTY